MSPAQHLDSQRAASSSDRIWEQEILPVLDEYIRIPNRSPAFEPGWEQAGQMERAVALLEGWCRRQPLPGIAVEVVRLPGRTPLLFIDMPGSAPGTILLYGHLDKQPEATGWRNGLGPWTPVREGDRLYGRGGADDGYATFACVAALRLLAEQKAPHARCVAVIESCEESGSTDLPAYIDALAPRIGQPDLVVCLDSGCGNYEQLWMTNSLRGLVSGALRIEVLTEGVHSGDASGIVPSSFRILRQLLDRLDDAQTGRVLIEDLHVAVPPERLAQARVCAQALGSEVWDKFPWAQGTRPVTGDLVELILNRTWRPALSITGCDGLPPVASAGNVLRPSTSVKISMRIPPRVDAERATEVIRRTLEADPPYGATVRFEPETASPGWDAPPLQPWLSASIENASRAYFGKPAAAMGEGGTIPFMGMLGERFPQAQFLITGVLGPTSNAHGPNEFLHLPTSKRLTACVAQVIADHAARPR